MFLRCFFVCFNLAGILFHAAARLQEEDYYIQHFTDENGLPQNSIKGMEMDANGYLWMATEMGMVRYDGTRFRSFNEANTPVMKGDRILMMGKAGDSSLYFITPDKKYFRLEGSPPVISERNNRIEKSRVELVTIDRYYEFYERCNALFQNNKKPEWIVPDGRSIKRSLLNAMIFSDDGYFYCNAAHELVRSDRSFSRFKKIIFDSRLRDSILVCDAKNLPFGLLNDQLNLFLRCGKYIYLLKFDADSSHAEGVPVFDAGNISNVTVYRTYPSIHATIIGTMSDGFYIYKKKTFSTRGFGDNESNIFYALAAFGTDAVLTKKGVLHPGYNNKMSLRGFSSESLLATKDHHYFLNRWTSRADAGIAELDSSLQEVAFIPEYDLHVSCFRQFSDGSIWFSDPSRYLGKLDGDRVAWMQRPKALPADFRINTFLQANNQQLFIAGDKGMAVVDASGSLVHLPEALKGVDVRYLYEDKYGSIWIGTYGKGLFAWYKNKVIHLPLDREGFTNTVHSFLEDKRGYAWISSNKGLFEVAMKDLYTCLNLDYPSLYYYYYNKTAGFLSNEFNGGCTPSVAELNNGQFVLPSLHGIVSFFPDSVEQYFPTGSINLDALSIDDQPTTSTGNNIIVPASSKRVQFTISSPYFGNPVNQVIEYSVEGLNERWARLSNDGMLVFDKLPAGSYSLELRKMGGFGTGYIIKEINFTVLPFFYETLLFKLGLVLLTSLVVYALFYRRQRYLVRQKNKLEAEVIQKTKGLKSLVESLEITVKELEVSRDEVHRSNLFIQNVAMIIAHDLHSPLRFLNDEASRLRDQIQGNELTEAARSSKEVQKASALIHQFVEEFGLWIRTRVMHYRPDKTTIHVNELMDHLRDFFAVALNTRHNNLRLAGDDGMHMYTDRYVLEIILRNIIDNANKHVKNGEILVELMVNDGRGYLSVKDNGPGISRVALQRINHMVKNPHLIFSNGADGSGYGYKFIVAFCGMLGFELRIDSSPENGTLVEISNIKVIAVTERRTINN